MFTDFYILFRNRERARRISRFLKIWLKRIYYLIPIVKIITRSIIARRHGAQIGELVYFGQATINGPWEKLKIGEKSSLGQCVIALHDTVSIGKCVVINDGAQLLTGTHELQDPTWSLKTGAIVIEDYAWIATNAILLPGISVGRGAVVGAGAVVLSDVPDFALVLGNPGQVIPNKRTKEYSYYPAILNAPFEAWFGHAGGVKDFN